MKLVILSCFAALSAAAVLDLGDSDFDSKLANIDNAVVMFYAPWCGHCKKLKPEFKEAAKDLINDDPPVHLVQVDCTEAGKDTCGRFGVKGYPTLKIFKSGTLSADYNGPREKDGIVRHMRLQVGPVSMKLVTMEDCKKFLEKKEPAVVFFGGESKLHTAFLGAADILRESVRFGHVVDSAVIEALGQKSDTAVLFRAPHLKNKFEEAAVSYAGAEDKNEIKMFIKDNRNGLVGHRTRDTADSFAASANPLVVVYFSIDYIKNVKATNYWRNRVLKVATKFSSDFNFAIADKNEFTNELEEFGINFVESDKPVVCVKDQESRKFVMTEKFSMDDFEAFLTKLKAGELEAVIKSEAVPESQDNVIVAVGKNFEEVVTDSGRDALVEFYAPWCGHCKKLAPIYEELGELMKDEDVDIVKIDADANDVPASFDVRGFPTLYWKPKSGNPIKYDGGRELDDLVKYISKHSTEELLSHDRSGNPKKTEL